MYDKLPLSVSLPSRYGRPKKILIVLVHCIFLPHLSLARNLIMFSASRSTPLVSSIVQLQLQIVLYSLWSSFEFLRCSMADYFFVRSCYLLLFLYASARGLDSMDSIRYYLLNSIHRSTSNFRAALFAVLRVGASASVSKCEIT